MATQTLTNVTRNYDDSAISGLLNGETLTIINSTLNINSDVRWGQQAAVFGNISISTTGGGLVSLDATQTKWIAYTGGTGNVPALGTAGTNDVTGSVAGAGEFLGVWTALGTAPLASGTAMPATGFIKLRSSSVAFAVSEVMTFTGGATATISTIQAGWIHVVGAEVTSITVPRLGEFRSRGDWFELGTTNGTNDQTFQFPVTDVCNAFQMETSPGSGIYEWWLNADWRWGTATQFVSTDVRGKYFHSNPTTGVITIARSGAQACGYLPASGCKVRIPNIILSSSNSTNWALNTVSTTIATRYDTATSGGGLIDLQHLSCNWYLTFSAAFSVSLKHSAVLQSINLVNVASTTLLDNLGIVSYAQQVGFCITATGMFSGCTFKNIRMSYLICTASGGANFNFIDCDGIIIENVQSEVFGALATTEHAVALVYALLLSRTSNVTVDEFVAVAGVLTLSASSDITIKNFSYADRLNGTTTSLFGRNVISITASSARVYVDGVSLAFPAISGLSTYAYFFNLSNSKDVEIRNVGTPSAPLDLQNLGSSFSLNYALNTIIRRVYFSNTRINTIPWTISNSQNITYDNFWVDGTDTSLLYGINMQIRGARFTLNTALPIAIYGTHWVDSFQNTTQGQIAAIANEPLAGTASQVAITAGTPKFTSQTSIAMPTVGDQVTWTMPYFALGHTQLDGAISNFIVGALPQNIESEYQIDTGSGFSAWKFLMCCRFTSTTAFAGTTTMSITTIATGRQPAIDDYVSTLTGLHFTPGTTIINIVGSVFTLSAPLLTNISSAVQVCFSRNIADEPSFDPAIGVKLKIRATAHASNLNTTCSIVRIGTTTDSVSQQIQYPLPVVLNEAKILGLLTGSRIRVYNVTTATEITNEVVVGTEWSVFYGEGTDFTTGDIVEVRVAKLGYTPLLLTAVVGSTGWAVLASQELDDIYTLYGIDGSLVTKFTPDYTSLQVDLNVASNFLGSEFYAWYNYVTTTEDGIRYFYGALSAIDAGNLEIDSSLVDFHFDNLTTTNVFQNDNIRIFRSDGNYPVTNPTTGGGGIDLVWRNQVYPITTGGSGLTPSESATLSKIDSIKPDLVIINDGVKKSSLIIPHTTDLP